MIAWRRTVWPLLAFAATLTCSEFHLGSTRADDSAVRPMVALSENERVAIDARAIDLAPQSFAEQQLEFYSDVTGWLVARTPLPLDGEIRAANAAHEAYIKQTHTVPAPAWADAVFKKLVEALPAHMRPDEAPFTLTVIDEAAPTSSTLGAGRVYISRGYLDLLLADEHHRDDRLAFVLAAEIGHVCHGHCRWAYRLQRLQNELDGQADAHINREALVKMVQRSIHVTGDVVRFLYDHDQVFQSDLFALHLCRNAGFDLENGLDVLRFQVDMPVFREGEAPAEPSLRVSPIPARQEPRPPAGSAASEKVVSTAPSSLARLQRLRNELDGRVIGDEFGLFEFDRKTHKYEKLKDESVADGERAMIFIHGIDSHFGIYRPAVEYLSTLATTKDVRLICFHYPNDDSLAKSGRFLRNELARVGGNPVNFDFICHSAGGLLFRYFAEIEHGSFRKAVFQGTPHAGSDLAKLRMLLEAKQFLRGLRTGMPESIEMALRDGHGQISLDLQPDSLFLRYLNASKRDQLLGRYFIFRGRAIESEAALGVLDTALAVTRISLHRRIVNSGHSELLVECADSLVDALTIPKEVSEGDLAVTLDSAALAGVTFMATYEANHISLVKSPVIIKAVAKVLLDGVAEVGEVQ